MPRVAVVSRRRIWGALAVAAVLLLAAALRLPGLHWGVPDALHPDYSFHPDEATTVSLARSLASGQLLLGHFMYGGTLYFSLLGAFHHYGQLFSGTLRGGSDLANTILFGRYFFVFCSLLTVALTYRIGARLFGFGAGLLGALFLALCPAHAFLAQNVRPDEFSTLVAMLLLWLGVLILQGQPSRDRLHFAVAGLILGAAVALRFPLAAFAAAPVLAYPLRQREIGWRAGCVGLLHWRLPLLAGAAALAYALTSPYSLLYFGSLLRGLELQRMFQTMPFADATGRGPGFYQYGWLTLQQALGVPLHLLALGGVVLAAVRRSAARLLLLVPMLAYFVPVTMVTWVVVRYTLPILPVLSLLAADLVFSLGRRSPAWGRFAVAAAAGALAWTMLGDIAFLRVQSSRNVRELASDWIQAHVQKGASLVEVQQYADDTCLNPPIPAGYRHLVLELGSGAESVLLQKDADHDYVMLNGAIYSNMDRLRERNPQAGAYSLQQILDGGRYRLVSEITVPVRFLGLDFSSLFTSQDFRVINPGERIYRYLEPPIPAIAAQ